MRKAFAASLCKGGLLGGGLYVTDTGLMYCTNKLSVEEKYRRLSMPYGEIASIESATWMTVRVSMRNGEVYRFWVFGRARFLRSVNIG